LHDLAVKFLTFAAEQPVEKELRAVRVRRIFDDADDAVAVARRQPLFRRRQLLDGQSRVDERLVLRMARAHRERELRLRERVGDLPEIAADEEILLHQLSQKILALELPAERPQRLSGAGHARVAEADSALPLGIQEIVE